jgi:hypothetical protein
MQQRYSMSWLALEYAHADGGYDDHDVFNCGKAAECMKAVDGTVALRGSIQCVNNHWHCFEAMENRLLATLPESCRPASDGTLTGVDSKAWTNGCKTGPTELTATADGALKMTGSADDCWCLVLDGFTFEPQGGAVGSWSAIILGLAAIAMVYGTLLGVGHSSETLAGHRTFWRHVVGLVRDGVSFTISTATGGRASGESRAGLLASTDAEQADAGSSKATGDHIASAPPSSRGVRAKRGASSALHHAAATGNTSALQRCLISASHAVIDSGDQRGFTPFHVACAAGYTACVESLTAAGCDTELLNDVGLTGWDLAAELKRDAVLALRPTGPAPPRRGIGGNSGEGGGSSSHSPKKKKKNKRRSDESKRRSPGSAGGGSGSAAAGGAAGAEAGGGLAESKALKAELKHLGLSSKGSKAELRARLTAACGGGARSVTL